MSEAARAAWLLLLLAGLLTAPSWAAGGRRPRGCSASEAAQPERAQVERLNAALAQGRHAAAADAAWCAWCASERGSYLPDICALHLKSGDCPKAREILGYAERQKLDAHSEDKLQKCREELAKARCNGDPALPAAPAPAPPAPVAPALSSVQISTLPPGASIFIDGGAARGQTDSTLQLPAGAHSLRLELQGYKPLEHQLVLVAGVPLQVQLNLTPLHARLQVNAMVSDSSALHAEVIIDGQRRGRVPQEFELSEGPHTLEVSRPGYRSYATTVTLARGQFHPLLVRLEPDAPPPVLPGPPPQPSGPPAQPSGPPAQPSSPQPLPPAPSPLRGRLVVKVLGELKGARYWCGEQVLPEDLVLKEAAIAVPVGICRLRMEREGYQTITKDVPVNEGQPATAIIPVRRGVQAPAAGKGT